MQLKTQQRSQIASRQTVRRYTHLYRSAYFILQTTNITHRPALNSESGSLYQLTIWDFNREVPGLSLYQFSGWG